MLSDSDADADKSPESKSGLSLPMAITNLQRGFSHNRFDSLRSDPESLPEPDLDTELSQSDRDSIASAERDIHATAIVKSMSKEGTLESEYIGPGTLQGSQANHEDAKVNDKVQLGRPDSPIDLVTLGRPDSPMDPVTLGRQDSPNDPVTLGRQVSPNVPVTLDAVAPLSANTSVATPLSEITASDLSKASHYNIIEHEANQSQTNEQTQNIDTKTNKEPRTNQPSSSNDGEPPSSSNGIKERSSLNGLMHTSHVLVLQEDTTTMQQNEEIGQSATNDASIPEAYIGPVDEGVPRGNPPSPQRQFYKESNAGDGTTTFEQQVHGARLVATLVSCVSALFITALDQTIISTLLTEVGDKFGAFEKIGWLSLGYLLPMATLAPSYGKVSIAFGRKNLILFGIVIFEIGSLVCALANSMDMLIAGRVIQGIGGGAIQAMVVVILTELVPMTKRALSFVLLGLTFSIASVLGPFVGGAFTTKVTWRWCFYINIPVGAVAFVLLWVGFRPPAPAGNLRDKLRKIDYIGTALLTVGLVLFLLGLTFGGVDFPWKSAAVICCFCFGGSFLFLFCLWNFKYSSNPIIIKEIVMTPQVFAASMAAMFNFGFFMANLIYLAVYFQVIFNATAWRSGIDLLPLIVLVSLTSMLNGAFLKFTRNVKLTMLMLGVLGPLGCGLLLLLTKTLPVRNRIGFLIVIGISVGLQFQSSVLAAQLRTPSDIEGSIIFTTIFLNFAKCVGGAISISLAQLIFLASGSHYVVELLDSLDKDSPEYAELIEVVPKALISSPRLIWGLSPGSKDMVLDEFMRALQNVFYMSLSFACTSCVFSIFTTNRKIPSELELEPPEDRATDAELRETIIANNDASSIAPPLNENEWMALTRTNTRKSQC